MKTKVVAVNLRPAAGRVRETEFYKADTFEWSKSGNTLRVLRSGTVVASFDRGSVRGVRFSSRKFNSEKVKFVRRFIAEPTLSGMLGTVS